MIRISDFAAAAAWARPLATTTVRAEAQDASGWFTPDAVSAEVRLSGDLDPAARGLTVDQHAARVLASLCGERERDA